MIFKWPRLFLDKSLEHEKNKNDIYNAKTQTQQNNTQKKIVETKLILWESSFTDFRSGRPTKGSGTGPNLNGALLKTLRVNVSVVAFSCCEITSVYLGGLEGFAYETAASGGTRGRVRRFGTALLRSGSRLDAVATHMHINCKKEKMTLTGSIVSKRIVIL